MRFNNLHVLVMALQEKTAKMTLAMQPRTVFTINLCPFPVKLPQGRQTTSIAEQITKYTRGYRLSTLTRSFIFSCSLFKDLELEVDIKIQSRNRLKFRRVTASEPKTSSDSHSV